MCYDKDCHQLLCNLCFSAHGGHELEDILTARYTVTTATFTATTATTIVTTAATIVITASTPTPINF